MSAKTIMFVVNVDWFFLSHRLPIALEAKKRGYNVHVAARVTENLDLLQSYDFIVHPLVLDRSSTGLGSAISTFLQLYKILSLVKPDLVHLVTIKPVLLGGLAARFVGVPSVVAAISGLGYIFVSKNFVSSVRRAIVGVLYRLALGHSNLKVIFQNKDDKKSVCKLASLPTSKTELIAGSGVDLAQYCVAPFPKSEVIVMLPARLLGDKGVREFVKASQHLQLTRPDLRRATRFVLVGSIDEANPTSITEKELAQWVRDGIVESWGYRCDMPKVLQQAYLVVLPSYYGEGLPKVLIEAAASGRAIVTTDHPGCRDAIEPGISGVLVPTRDSLALAEAIEGLLDDSERCKKMGSAGRSLAERVFSVNKVVEKHMVIYNELLVAAK